MTKLFSSFQIKNLSLNNRLVMPPMALDIAALNGEVSSEIIEHYTRRAQGKPGLILIEHSYVLPEGKAHPRQLGIYGDFLLPGLRSLAAAVHSLGVSVGIQITHAGARALDSPSGPSAVYNPHLKRFNISSEIASRQIPSALSSEALSAIKEAFAQAALRARKAGFDLVEIHGAHGYLLNEFYSPLTNLRTDGYGGSLEKRLRFPLEIVQAVRTAVGDDFPVFYRLGADDRLPGGNTLTESKTAAAYLVEAGVDCLDLSGGICGYLKQGPAGFFNYLAEGLRPAVKVPVLVTGGIKTPEEAAKVIDEGVADLVGIGRAMLDDPEWPQKAWEKLSAKEN